MMKDCDRRFIGFRAVGLFPVSIRLDVTEPHLDIFGFISLFGSVIPRGR